MDSILNVRALLVGVVACALLGSGCQSAGRQRTTAPTATSQEADGVTHRLDAAVSELHFLVYRAGPFARLGHNHVVAARDLSGQLSLTREITGSSFELLLPVERLEVDPARWRAHYGDDFASTPSAADVDGTRANMLGAALLDSTAYPFIRVAGRISRARTPSSADIEIAIKDTVLERTVPVALAIMPDTVTASGSVTIDHAELGLTPFSVMLGALRVAEGIEVRFDLVANRVNAPPRVDQPD